jgi:hypothetical protein
MGLIGDNCVTCRYAAQNDNGVAGGWWRFWAEVFWLLAYSTENGADFGAPRAGDRRTTTRVTSALASLGVLCWL